MFLSRKTELERMKSFMSSDGRASLIYGRRRVGKTSLVRETSKFFKGKIISYLCTKESYEVNLDDLTGEYCLAFGDSNRTFSSFPDFFRFLRTLDEDILVILDEYSNLKESYGGIETDSIIPGATLALKWENADDVLGIYQYNVKDDNTCLGKITASCKIAF